MSKTKNPAVNFYSGDFLTSTAFFTNEEVGAYIRLLLYQHQQGRLEEEKVNIILKELPSEKKQKILSKFLIDKNGFYYNKRMEKEIIKKRKYSESRANNRKKKQKESEDKNNICNSYDSNYEQHMENENENINIYINNNIKNILNYLKENNIIITNDQLDIINNFRKEFTEEEIIKAFKISYGKSINYTFGILKNWILRNNDKRSKPVPEWFNKDLSSTNECDLASNSDYEEFKDFIKKFRNNQN